MRPRSNPVREATSGVGWSAQPREPGRGVTRRSRHMTTRRSCSALARRSARRDRLSSCMPQMTIADGLRSGLLHPRCKQRSLLELIVAASLRPSPTATASSANWARAAWPPSTSRDDLKHDRPVAIKVLHPELAAVIGGERFLSEIKITANLQHPHILPLFDGSIVILRERRIVLLYYVMPFVDGESLRDRLTRDKQLPVDDADPHRHGGRRRPRLRPPPGIVHRDIKPENILLQDGRALVADFGIALAVQHGRRQSHDPDRHVARHALLHVARAGDGRARHRPPQRRLRARRHDLRDAGRRSALHRQYGAVDRRQGDDREAAPPSPHPRHGAAERRARGADGAAEAPRRSLRTAKDFADALEDADAPAPTPRPWLPHVLTSSRLTRPGACARRCCAAVTALALAWPRGPFAAPARRRRRPRHPPLRPRPPPGHPDRDPDHQPDRDFARRRRGRVLWSGRQRAAPDLRPTDGRTGRGGAPGHRGR